MMAQLVSDLLYIGGDGQQTDVRKKLKIDCGKNGDWNSFWKFQGVLEQAASYLYDCLPKVIQDGLKDPQNHCQFSIRVVPEDSQENGSRAVLMSSTDYKLPKPISRVFSMLCLSVASTDEATPESYYQGNNEVVGELCRTPDSCLNLVVDSRPVSDATADIICENLTLNLDLPSKTEQSNGNLESVNVEHGIDPYVENVTCSAADTTRNCSDQVLASFKKKTELELLKINARNPDIKDSKKLESEIEVRTLDPVEGNHTCDVVTSNNKEDEMAKGEFYFHQPLPSPGKCHSPMNVTRFTVPGNNNNNYIYVDRLLGGGGYGRVFKGYDRISGIILAIKKMKIVEQKDANDVDKEIDTMKLFDHKNIVRLIGWERQDHEYHIFLEWMAGGSVEDLVNRYGPLSEGVIQSYSTQVFCGVAYLHAIKILHCDIKGANILVDSTGQVVKLCDFGLALPIPVPPKTPKTKERGTIFFMAPELFNGHCNSSGSDVWSIGCTIYQMATGKQPWDEFKHVSEYCVILKICTQTLPKPSLKSACLQKVLSCCLQRDVNLRQNASQLQEVLENG